MTKKLQTLISKLLDVYDLGGWKCLTYTEIAQNDCRGNYDDKEDWCAVCYARWIREESK